MTRFYTIERLGPHRELTPEGFLLCRDVPVARTGLQIYAADEVPPDLVPDADGYVRVEREPEEVFRPATIESFRGKDVVLDHPMVGHEMVNVLPDNYRRFSVGVAMDPRRGAGLQDDLLLMDLLVKDENAIRRVMRDEVGEISAGYDAEYESTGPGRGRQYNIVGNHIAFVKSGRCGPRCRVPDHAARVITHDAADCGLHSCRCGGHPVDRVIRSRDRARSRWRHVHVHVYGG